MAHEAKHMADEGHVRSDPWRLPGFTVQIEVEIGRVGQHNQRHDPIAQFAKHFGCG